MPESDSAAKQLAWHYENPMAQAIAAHRAGIPVVALTSNTIPWELIQAAGLFPVMLRPARRATPAADEYMETDVFQARIRQIFESAVSGEWSFLSAIILSRTSEQEYKLFLYLREVARESPREGMPPVYLYDLLHSQSAETRAYGISRTEELKHQLEAIAGRRIDAPDLAQAIAESNAARAAVRRLLALRQDAVRLAGTEARPLVGAYWFMARPEYAKLATEAADIIRQRQTLQGVRLIVKGAPLDHVQLHAVLESHGAIVVAEDDWWGTRSVGSDIEASGDPVKAIFEHYYRDAPSPRVFPPGAADRWFESRVREGVDGVVFYLPPEDSVLGWDFPRQKHFLDGLHIPSLVVEEDPCAGGPGPELHASIARFVNAIAAER
jgi:benzoyl-CoA reductase/2-hydroxyglutaryl-CoA dehydratase subunit BcrC/BadD/HgdB